MNAIRTGIINESTKLFKRSKYKILLICIGILCIALGLISNFTGGLINVSLSNLPLNILSILTNVLNSVSYFYGSCGFICSRTRKWNN